jgi:hypothetical protein
MYCNMVHLESCMNNKKNYKDDVRVRTRGGEKIGMEFELGEISSPRMEGKITRAAQPPLKFDVAQYKKFMCDA